MPSGGYLPLEQREKDHAEGPCTYDPEKNQDDRDWQCFGHDERVEDQDIDDDGTEDGEAQGDELLNDDEQTTDNFHYADEVEIARADHASEELARRAGREGLRRNEVEEMVGAAKDENGAEEDAGDERGDLHVVLLDLSRFRDEPKNARSAKTSA